MPKETLFPKVSIILPIRNEEQHIAKTLNSIQHQQYDPEKIEIFVVDGMSTDRTRTIISNCQSLNRNIQLMDNPEGIVPTGINLALPITNGEIIIRIDGHCEIAPDYVAMCVQYLLSESVDCVGGPIETIGETHLAQAIAIGMSSKFGVGGSAFRTIKDQKFFVDTVAFPAFTRQAIEKTGLFDEELVRNQDDEYSYRLRKWGGKILLVPDVKSKYFSRSSLLSLWRQYFQYGYWKVRVLQKHPLQMRLRQFVPLILVSALLFPVPFVFFFPQTLPFYLLIPATYLITNLGASLITASQRGWQYLPYLPIVYAILHLSYGTGFLIGLIKFANRWGDKKGQVPDFRPVES